MQETAGEVEAEMEKRASRGEESRVRNRIGREEWSTGVDRSRLPIS